MALSRHPRLRRDLAVQRNAAKFLKTIGRGDRHEPAFSRSVDYDGASAPNAEIAGLIEEAAWVRAGADANIPHCPRKTAPG